MEHTRLIARSVVGLQLALIACSVALPGPVAFTLPTWARVVLVAFAVALVVASGLALTRLGSALTASPVPRADGELVTGGPYAWVRHPVYSALAAAALCVSVASGRPARIASAVALLLLFEVKSRWEERMLAARYPGYADYAARTPRLIPRPPARTGGR